MSLRSARGQAMVEMALIAPVFLFLVLAIVEGALLLNAQATLDTATREGARAAAICGTTQGPFSYRDGTYSTCPEAARGEFTKNAGILYTDPAHRTVLVCDATTVDATTGKCPSGQSSSQSSTLGSSCTATVSCGVQVDVSYNYDFFLNPLLGRAAPSVSLTSRARSIGQQ
jgi:Flp pilus assembly protein TadG